MDTEFRKMLEEAEKIRAECRVSGDLTPHLNHMINVVKYGMDKKLFVGEVDRRVMIQTASEEYIAQLAESAVCMAEVIFDEQIGPVLDIPVLSKIRIINRLLNMIEVRL